MPPRHGRMDPEFLNTDGEHEHDNTVSTCTPRITMHARHMAMHGRHVTSTSTTAR